MTGLESIAVTFIKREAKQYIKPGTGKLPLFKKEA